MKYLKKNNLRKTSLFQRLNRRWFLPIGALSVHPLRNMWKLNLILAGVHVRVGVARFGRHHDLAHELVADLPALGGVDLALLLQPLTAHGSSSRGSGRGGVGEPAEDTPADAAPGWGGGPPYP